MYLHQPVTVFIAFKLPASWNLAVWERIFVRRTLQKEVSLSFSQGWAFLGVSSVWSFDQNSWSFSILPVCHGWLQFFGVLLWEDKRLKRWVVCGLRFCSTFRCVSVRHSGFFVSECTCLTVNRAFL